MGAEWDVDGRNEHTLLTSAEWFDATVSPHTHAEGGWGIGGADTESSLGFEGRRERVALSGKLIPLSDRGREVRRANIARE